MNYRSRKVDLSFARAVPVAARRTPHTLLHLAGCNQIGGWLAPSVARIARALQQRQRERRFDLIFSDSGLVADEDIDYGNFCPVDIGRRRADVLAGRYGRAWGLEIGSLARAYPPAPGGCTMDSAGSVVLTCGDPSAYLADLMRSLSERQYTGDGFMPSSRWWVGAGRSGERGRVLAGSTHDPQVLADAFKVRTLCTALPVALNDSYSDHCVRLSADPLERIRSMVIDQSLAAEAADYLLRLLTWQLKKNVTFFEGGEACSNFILPDAVSTEPPEVSPLRTLAKGHCVRAPSGSLDLVLVGCGGTGGWLVPALARLGRTLHASGRDIRLTLIDHDRVEPANILRQNFCDAEVGLYKAESMAARHSALFGRSLRAITERFKAPMVREYNGDTVILIGCVDNAAARQELSQALELAPQPIWWQDCGNHAESGQVRIGSTTSPKRLGQTFDADGFCTALPAPSLQSPDLLVPWAETLSTASESCEQMAIGSTQSLIVNQRAAATAARCLVALVSGTLNFYATHFDMPTGAIRSLPIAPRSLQRFTT